MVGVRVRRRPARPTLNRTRTRPGMAVRLHPLTPWHGCTITHQTRQWPCEQPHSERLVDRVANPTYCSNKTCACARIQERTHACTHTHARARAHTHTHTIYIYIYIYTHTHTHRRQASKQPHRACSGSRLSAHFEPDSSQALSASWFLYRACRCA